MLVDSTNSTPCSTRVSVTGKSPISRFVPATALFGAGAAVPFGAEAGLTCGRPTFARDDKVRREVPAGAGGSSDAGASEADSVAFDWLEAGSAAMAFGDGSTRTRNTRASCRAM